MPVPHGLGEIALGTRDIEEVEKYKDEECFGMDSVSCVKMQEK